MELQDRVQADELTEELSSRYLTFFTDGQLFGIPIAQIVQIAKIQQIIWLPQNPPYVKGIINLRGQVIPVIDIRLRFGKPEIPADERTCIIIIHMDGKDFGLIVDEVDEVADIQADQISDPPRLNSDYTEVSAYLSGIATLRADSSGRQPVAMLLHSGKILGQQAVTLPPAELALELDPESEATAQPSLP